MTHNLIINFTIKIYVPNFIEKFVVLIVLWLRKKKYGYPFRRIKLTQGKFAIVDVEDYRMLIQYDWCAANNLCTFYAMRKENRKNIKMHRQIMNPPPYLFVDHINHNGLDNRKANLRIVTPAQNSRNRVKGKNKKSSKYKGVCLDKETNKWRSAIRFNRKPIHLGYFESEEDAAKAYDEAAEKLFGEFASLNFPQVASTRLVRSP